MRLAWRKLPQNLIERDGALLEYGVGERAIAARLGGYLTHLFPDHDVDVEYNRHGIEPKMLYLPPECHGGGEKRIFPDIVVHHRGNDRNNLLVVELKKETNREPRTCDRAKILALKEQFGYAYGVLLEVPAEPGASLRRPLAVWL